MLELSPLETAAKASASSIARSVRVSRSKPVAGDPPAREAGAEPAERVRVLIDHGDRVAQVLHAQGQRGTYAATAMITICNCLVSSIVVARTGRAKRAHGLLAALCLSSVGRAAQCGG